MPPDQDEPADVACRPGLPASQGEGQGAEHGDRCGHDGPVRPVTPPGAAWVTIPGLILNSGDDSLLPRHRRFLLEGVSPGRTHRHAVNTRSLTGVTSWQARSGPDRSAKLRFPWACCALEPRRNPRLTKQWGPGA